MNELFLVVWTLVASGFSCCCPTENPDSAYFGGWCDEKPLKCEGNNVKCEGKTLIQSQTVTSQSELTELYEQHKDDGVRVWKVEKKSCDMNTSASTSISEYGTGIATINCSNEITELEFKKKPCGSWEEKE